MSSVKCDELRPGGAGRRGGGHHVPGGRRGLPDPPAGVRRHGGGPARPGGGDRHPDPGHGPLHLSADGPGDPGDLPEGPVRCLCA